SNLGTDSGSKETVSRTGLGFSAALLASAAAPIAAALPIAASFTASLALRLDLAISCSAPARMAAGVLGSATPELGESEMSSSRLKSSAEAVRGSGLSSGGTEQTCVSELALASSPRDVSVATV